MKFALAAGIIALVSMATINSANGGITDPTKLVDLTYVFDTNTVYWPTEPPLVHQFEHYGMTPGGYFYSSAKFAAPEHGGTHMDAPIHFSANGMTADQVPLSSTVGPAVVIDFSSRTAQDPNAMLSDDDIKRWEAAHGPIPDGAIVVARSGWGQFWPDKKHYLGTDKHDDVAHLRFPGFSIEAIKFLLENRKAVAIAIDTASIDPGNSKDFPVHRAWLGANKPAFENLANADKLPPTGATLFCVPMKMGKGTGAPTRIFALLP
ncbi:MAG TPA: cyclase family protein [Candidatus Binataceae bacterium]|nr:cyclase family protein [Candidatus Binataceae bacterium]